MDPISQFLKFEGTFLRVLRIRIIVFGVSVLGSA